MDKSNGLFNRTRTERSRASDGTRTALLGAAAELIGERGWSAVTTRAIAERAGVPHGAVSYHFAGKQDLLRRAAFAVIDMTFSGMVTVAESPGQSMRGYLAASADQLRAIDAAQSGAKVTTLAECLVHACRDDELAQHLRDWLRAYRESLTSRAAADDTIAASANARQLAVLITAVMDGLWLHLTVDPELDIEGACRLLADLLVAQ